MLVRHLMSYPIVTVHPEATVQEAILRMVGESKGSVLVARDGLFKEALGIITTSHIFMNVFAKGLDPGRISVSQIMTPAPLITIDPDASTTAAAKMMQENGIRRIPVMRDGTLVGIITSNDLLKCVQ